MCAAAVGSFKIPRAHKARTGSIPVSGTISDSSLRARCPPRFHRPPLSSSDLGPVPVCQATLAGLILLYSGAFSILTLSQFDVSSN